MRLTLVLLTAAILVGCGQPYIDDPTPDEKALFGPSDMRVHPIFTEAKDWDGDGRLDGIEVLLEFQDQFGDPTKAAGTVMFELYNFRQATPDPRGRRLVNPWVGSILTEAEQRARWNRTSRTYTFQLAYPRINANETYVLTASFRSSTEGRFFDEVVLPPQEEPLVPPSIPTTAPTTQPDAAVVP